MLQKPKRTGPYFVFQKMTPISAYQIWRNSKNLQNQITEAEQSQSAFQQSCESDCFIIVKNYRQKVRVQKIRKIRKLKIKEREVRQLQSHFQKIQVHKLDLTRKGYPTIDKDCLLNDLRMVKEQIMSQNQDQNVNQWDKNYLKMGIIQKKSSIYCQQFVSVEFKF